MSKENKIPVVGITIGDLNGIGPEIILKTLNDSKILHFCTPVIFASTKVMNYYRKMMKNIQINFISITDFESLKPKNSHIFNCWQEEVAINLGEPTPISGKYAVRSLEVATQCLKDGQIDILVTAPIDKNNSFSENFPYKGHTDYFKEKFNASQVTMILFHQDFRVATLTGHVSLEEVKSYITKTNITAKIKGLIQTLKRDFGIDKPKIAVLGLNPHSGDKGTIGKEEQEVIVPVISEFKNAGNFVYGPYSSDSFFARDQYKHFDITLGMYHDQILTPFKMLDQDMGVNYTSGFDKIRTSPDHGTAFDIVGKNIANESSFRQAIFSAIDILKMRSDYDYCTANPLTKAEITGRES